MGHTNEQIQEKFKALPKDIQGLVVDDDFGPAVTLLCKELGVEAVKALDVEDEVFDVLMGFSHPKDFIRNIQSKIGVDEEKARAIAEKVNDEIFQLVKESLKIVHNITETASEASVASVSSAPPDALRSTPNVPRPPAPPGSTPYTPRSTTSAFPQMIVPPKINIEVIQKPPTQPSQNIFEQKLQGVFKMPKEETLVPQKPSFSPTPPTPPRPSGVDPYREQPK